MASPFGCRSGHISAFAEATLPRDGQVGEGVSPALDAQTEKHNDLRRSTYSLQQRNDVERVAVPAFRSFGFELQGPCSAFTSWCARIRYTQALALPAHNQKLVFGHVTFVLQQLF